MVSSKKSNKVYINDKVAYIYIFCHRASDDEIIAAEADAAMREGVNMIAVGPKWSNLDGLKVSLKND